jgi:hypothetical protein
MAIKYFYDIVQGDNAWFEKRLGLVTASKINTILTPTGKPAKGEKVKMYAYEIASERETWRMEPQFVSFDMERGHIQEDLARQVYNESYAEVKLCGFIVNDNFGFKIGASPDGLVGVDGGIEIKSRLSKFQIQTVTEDIIPQEYMNQIQACMLVSGRKWWDYVQYSNGMPMYVKRVLPDHELQDAIVGAVTEFEQMVKEIRAVYNKNCEKLVKTSFVELELDDEIQGSEE